MPEPAIDRDVPVERLWLDDTSWVDVARGWISGADEVGAALLRDVAWKGGQIYRYDHWVDERRLGSGWRPPHPPPHPVVVEAHRSLQHRYAVRFDGCSLIQYRDGGDGQAFHRDTDMKWLDDTIIAVLTFGATRPWLLRPRANRHRDLPGRGATHDLAPAAGDLLVMGGRAQADWEHSVPYQRDRPVAPRVSLQWRHAAKRGRPFASGGYGAPLHYGDRQQPRP